MGPGIHAILQQVKPGFNTQILAGLSRDYERLNNQNLFQTRIWKRGREATITARIKSSTEKSQMNVKIVATWL